MDIISSDGRLISFIAVMLMASSALGFMGPKPSNLVTSLPKAAYLDDLNIFKASEKKCLVGFTTDSWNIGQRKYKEFLAVYNMYKRVQKLGLACIEIPMWELVQGPHFDDLQRLFETYWIPDMTSKDQFLLQYDLVVIPDPVLAKYMVEA